MKKIVALIKRLFKPKAKEVLQPCTDWPNVESDMDAWRQWAKGE